MKFPAPTSFFRCAHLPRGFKAGGAALLLGAAALLGTSGCVAVVAAGAAGAGVAWVRGALETDLGADIERSYAAAQRAVRELELTVISEKKSAVDASLLARTATDKRVQIVLHRSGARNSRVSIRVGVFGDEALALTILDRIKAGL